MDAAALKTFLTRHRMLIAEELELLKEASDDKHTVDLALERALIQPSLVEDAKRLLEEGKPTGLEPSLPGLVLLEAIGKGASGRVYRAWQVKLRRIVAVKVMPRETLRDERAKTRFIREARIAARLSHPSLVRAWDIGSAGESVYIILEYVEGESLQAHLHAKGPIGIAASLRIAHGIAEGLAYAAANGIAHRDIKPANIQLTSDGVKILDLGLARPEGESELTLPLTAVGTPAYISPEQARGETMLTPKADVYSLGVLIYRCIIGRHPFKAIDGTDMLRAHVERMPPALNAQAKDCPEALSELVETMMAKDPETRPSAAQVAGHLRLLLSQVDGKVSARKTSGRKSTVSSVMAPIPEAEVVEKTSWAITAGIGALALLIGALGMHLFFGDDPEIAQSQQDEIKKLEAENAALKAEREQDAKWQSTLKEIEKAKLTPTGSEKSAETRSKEALEDNNRRFQAE